MLMIRVVFRMFMFWVRNPRWLVQEYAKKRLWLGRWLKFNPYKRYGLSFVKMDNEKDNEILFKDLIRLTLYSFPPGTSIIVYLDKDVSSDIEKIVAEYYPYVEHNYSFSACAETSQPYKVLWVGQVNPLMEVPAYA